MSRPSRKHPCDPSDYVRYFVEVTNFAWRRPCRTQDNGCRWYLNSAGRSWSSRFTSVSYIYYVIRFQNVNASSHRPSSSHFNLLTGYLVSGKPEPASCDLLATTQIPDIDECEVGNGGCHQHATCDNEEGSFKCTCNGGYTGDGISCVGEEYLYFALIVLRGTYKVESLVA